MVSKNVLRVSLLLAILAGVANACVFMYGDHPDFQGTHANGTHWNHAMLGDDWEGHNVVNGAQQPWVCMSGKSQSPIDFKKGTKTGVSALKCQRTKWFYPPLVSDGNDLVVINNGHTVQVQWTSDFKAEVLIPNSGTDKASVLDVLSMPKSCDGVAHAKARPLQFHFHSNTEHMMEGELGVLELHIVHVIPQSELPGCPASGCLSVTGIMFKEVEQDNKYLSDILDVASGVSGVSTNFPKGTTIDLMKIMPNNGKGKYFQYSGSLTTPPCSEGLLWHVFADMVPIGKNQLAKYMKLIGAKSCELKAGGDDHSSRKVLADGVKLERHYSPNNLAYSRTTFAESNLNNGRSLLAENTSPDDWSCNVSAYGFNYRRTQPLHGRVIRRY